MPQTSNQRPKGSPSTPKIDINKLLNSPNLLGTGYISEEEIRERVLRSVDHTVKKRTMFDGEEAALIENLQKSQVSSSSARETWIKRLIEMARRRGRLMTSQQYADHLLGVKMQVGTPCRYIGPDREETSENGHLVIRPHGQRGVITDVREERRGRALVFHPHDAIRPITPPDAEPVFVDLVVREHTSGWLQLEREVPS